MYDVKKKIDFIRKNNHVYITSVRKAVIKLEISFKFVNTKRLKNCSLN